MKYTRVLVAKVALRVASEDEVFWLSKAGASYAQDVDILRTLAGLSMTPFCISDAELIRIADENKMSKMSHAAQEHLVSCSRCARIGQHIANMDNPETEARSLAG